MDVIDRVLTMESEVTVRPFDARFEAIITVYGLRPGETQISKRGVARTPSEAIERAERNLDRDDLIGGTMRNEDVEDEDEIDEDEEKEAPPQYYGCVLCSAVTLSDKVGGHRDADDREKTCDGELKKYPERFNRFVEDMLEEGFKVEHYAGRCYFNGPAVRVDQYGDPDDVVRATKVGIQRDSMGLGQILYPR